MRSGSHYQAGSTDSAGRWYPTEEIKSTPGSFKVRWPSRNYPNSFTHHYYTSKFAKLLLQHNPELFFELNRLDISLLENRGDLPLIEVVKAAMAKKKMKIN